MSSTDHGRWNTANVGAALMLAGFGLCWFWPEAGILSIVGVAMLLLGGIQDMKEDKARADRRVAEHRANAEADAERARQRGW